MKTIKATLLTFIGLALGATLAEAAEKSEAQKELLAKYDANKDGRLSTSEREKIRYDKLNPPKEKQQSSDRRRFRYPDPVIAKFDTDDDNELDEKEFGEARKWVDRRFKEINEEYDVNKDGRLNTNERAAVSKDVEAGKFKTMDWLMKYVTRPPAGAAAATATCARSRVKRPVWIYTASTTSTRMAGWTTQNGPTSVRP